MADPPQDDYPSSLSDDPVQDALNSMEKVSLQVKVTGHDPREDAVPRTPRPIVVYTREQLLVLYQSPLVKPLDDMPALKDWFGDWTEQTGKGHSDTSTAASTTRDRRFRRDQEDGEPPPRATFRSTLSQPSQMGNFKHQSSLRTSDRDRDKDNEKDKERDFRDRDGERLRSLSDKYDRERLAAPAGTGLRTKDRDSAPHLSSGASRLTAQNGLAPASGRRGEGRDAPRRKPGESSEDWRRGRDDRDRSDGQRRDRDDRERPRSPVRDLSRPRRDTTPPRRDREDRDRDRNRDRDDPRKREDNPRRDRDADRDNDDPRRWRDDGKRDERMASRRELRDRDRERDRERPGRNAQDSTWDADRPRDRDRWNNTDERDGRSKRANGRDRRAGSGDEGSHREERREREKEKEPAWMDTYVPTTSGGGILGGKNPDGEVDSIQAWKKSMKEKEKEKEKAAETSGTISGDRLAVEEPPEKPAPVAESQMDEIQLFKMMIKREEEKKKKRGGDSPADASAGTTPLLSSSSPGVSQSPGTSSNLPTDNGPVGPSASKNIPIRPPGVSSHGPLRTMENSVPTSRPVASSAEAFASAVHPHTPHVASSSPAFDSAHSSGSRFFPAPLEAANVNAPMAEKTAGVVKSPIPSQYDQPSGSRLLAFGSRTSSATSGAINGPALDDHAMGFRTNPPADAPMSFPSDVSRLGPAEQFYAQTKPPQMLGPRAQANYPSFENQLRPPITLDDDGYQDTSRRQSLHSIGDRQFGLQSDPYSEASGGHILGQSNYSPNSHSPALESSLPERSQGGSPYQAKVSRFAKYFDAKGRDVQPLPTGRAQGPPGFTSSSPLSFQRQDRGMNDSAGPDFENRTMEDIFAMLQSSSQGHNGHSNGHQGHIQHNNNGPPYQPTHAPLHAVHQHQHNVPQRNMDILYDNRLDDRNFVPDGMVPGLRSVPPPRARDHGPAMFQDPLDDMAFNVQPRLAQQPRMDPLYVSPSVYPQGRNVPIQQFRNGPSPIPNQGQSVMHGLGQQRGLPPGLANLGGRPPHEPSQFVSTNLGISPGGLQSGGGQSPFNNYPGGNGVGFAGAPQMRGPPPGPHPVPGGLGNTGMAGLHAKQVEIRTVNQTQLLGLGMGGMRVPSGGFGPQQGVPNAQMHAQQLAMRQQQQQQQQMQSHVLPRMLPPHLQAGPGPTGQPAQDLIALLMHGTRE